MHPQMTWNLSIVHRSNCPSLLCRGNALTAHVPFFEGMECSPWYQGRPKEFVHGSVQKAEDRKAPPAWPRVNGDPHHLEEKGYSVSKCIDTVLAAASATNLCVHPRPHVHKINVRHPQHGKCTTCYHEPRDEHTCGEAFVFKK